MWIIFMNVRADNRELDASDEVQVSVCRKAIDWCRWSESVDGAIPTENHLWPIDVSFYIMRPVIDVDVTHTFITEVSSTEGSNTINAALSLFVDSVWRRPIKNTSFSSPWEIRIRDWNLLHEQLFSVICIVPYKPYFTHSSWSLNPRLPMRMDCR